MVLSTLLPSVPNLQPLRYQTAGSSSQASLCGRHTVFYVLFQSLCRIFLVTSEALLLMQDSHDVLHDFSYIVYLKPLPLVVDTGCGTCSLISRYLSNNFLPIKSSLRLFFPMIMNDSNWMSHGKY